MGGAKAHYDGIVAFSQTDFTEDLKKINVPVLVMHSEDDQIVPYADAGPLSAKLLKNGTLKTYKDFPHGMPTTARRRRSTRTCSPFSGPDRDRGELGLAAEQSAGGKKGDVRMTLRPLHLSRRGFCLCCVATSGLSAAGGWLSPREAYAEARGLVTLIKDSAATSPLQTYKLRDGISVIEGSGGNIAVLTGPEGKVLVDGGIGVSRAQMQKTLQTLSSDPVTHLINTHWHFDHADGNAWLHGLGAKIIAQDNTRKYLSQVQRVEDWDYNFLPLPEAGLPTDVFTQEKALKLNGQTLGLKYYGPAHTDGDISVTFAEADVLHAGDTYWNGIYPFIDYSTHGSIDGMIAASDANLAATTDKTIIVPGHGKPVSNRAELKAFRDMLVGVRQNVAQLKAQGRSRDETVAAKPTAAFDAVWGRFLIDPDFFTRLVYEGSSRLKTHPGAKLSVAKEN